VFIFSGSKGSATRQSADPVLTRRKPPPNGGSGDSSGEEPAPQIANKQAKPPGGADRPQDTSSSLLLSIIALLISASMFTYFYMNLKQAGIIKETQKYRDINAELKVELADIIKGSDISFDIKRQAVCTKCQGTGARSKDDIVVCQHCRGRGSQTVKQRMGPMTWEVEQRCPYCGGAGKTIKHKCDVVCNTQLKLQCNYR
jgi:DnaJ-class molecular chaperone